MILLKQDSKHIEIETFEEKDEVTFESSDSTSGADIDPITQLRANLNQVEDLLGRVRFVMSEVRTVIQKKRT